MRISVTVPAPAVPAFVLAVVELDDRLGVVPAVRLVEVNDIRGQRRANVAVGALGRVQKAGFQRNQAVLAKVDGLLDDTVFPVPEVEPLAVLPSSTSSRSKPG